MFNGNNNTYWEAKNTVTINKDYTLKLITTGYDIYYTVLYCCNTFTNNGNVIIDDYGGLAIDYNDDTTISNSINKGTIDISNITDLYSWYNDGTFTLEGGSIFILPKSITMRIGSTGYTFNDIQLNGSSNNPVIFKTPYTITTPSNNITLSKMYTSLDDITTNTGFTFTGNTSNVLFISIDKYKYTISDITTIYDDIYNDSTYTLSLPQEGIDNIINTDNIIKFKITIDSGKNVTITGPKPLYIDSNIKVYGRVIFNTPVKGNGSITIYPGGSYRSSKPIGIKVINKGGKIVFK